MAKVKPLPEGTHTLTAQLVVKGAAKAIDYYKKAFDAKELTRFEGPDGKIMHASIRIGDSQVFLCDEMPEMNSLSPTTLGNTPLVMTLYTENSDAVFKRAVDAGAQVKMPMEDQFWGDRCGTLKDPHGYTWTIATHKEDLTPQEMQQRQAEWMKQFAPQSAHG